MLVFAASDKGGTGRSVTSCNVAFHLAQRHDVAYLDFDFGSPTAGAIFDITRAERGIEQEGMHSYFTDGLADPRRLDVWTSTSRPDLRGANIRAGRLTFFPGEIGGAEFGMTDERVDRCAELLTQLDHEYEVVLVDLSAGRSTALHMALAATALSKMRSVTCRWLVFHRWTRQHIVAAHGLVYGKHGILEVGKISGHDQKDLQEDIRFVRVAVPLLKEHNPAQSAPQATWLLAYDDELRKLAVDRRLGQSRVLGTTPVEPILQYREQLITESDVAAKIANATTIKGFRSLADRLVDDEVWEGA
ncbi:ParA family protein [Pseudonocardiaceae bacterium YIM PH 21723]|nr:ParA family protein [Pseudonocardiaceae bacterium YIM PH 21723]